MELEPPRPRRHFQQRKGQGPPRPLPALGPRRRAASGSPRGNPSPTPPRGRRLFPRTKPTGAAGPGREAPTRPPAPPPAACPPAAMERNPLAWPVRRVGRPRAPWSTVPTPPPSTAGPAAGSRATTPARTRTQRAPGQRGRPRVPVPMPVPVPVPCPPRRARAVRGNCGTLPRRRVALPRWCRWTRRHQQPPARQQQQPVPSAFPPTRQSQRNPTILITDDAPPSAHGFWDSGRGWTGKQSELEFVRFRFSLLSQLHKRVLIPRLDTQNGKNIYEIVISDLNEPTYAQDTRKLGTI